LLVAALQQQRHQAATQHNKKDGQLSEAAVAPQARQHLMKVQQADQGLLSESSSSSRSRFSHGWHNKPSSSSSCCSSRQQLLQLKRQACRKLL
jgi:hypothetical protein